MTKLRSILPIILLTCSLLAVGPIGCATTGANTQQTVAKVALVLKSTTTAGAVMAIKDNPDNRKHFELAAAILDQLLVDGIYKPGDLVAKLEPVFKELKKPEIALVVIGVLNLYEGLYGDYVKGKIGGNENAVVLLTALRDGARTGALIGNVNNPGGPNP